MNLYYTLVGHTSRYSYWSNSSFGRKIYKMFGMWENPKAAELGEFSRIRNMNAMHRPWVTWFVEEGLDIAQDFVYFPHDLYDNVKHKLRNRFVQKHYVLNTGLPKWEYHDNPERILLGLLETVVEFIEIEKAHMNDVFGDEGELKIKDRREAGLRYLDWEISLGEESPFQAEAAKELKEIYLWYKDIRPNRPDPMDESGWSKYCEDRPIMDWSSSKTDEERAMVKRMLDKTNNLEEVYDKEDEQMLIRIIKVRQSMWT